MSAKAPFPAWLREAVFYQVYPQSFCDTNGDGIGDLGGLLTKLEYLKDLGITAIWLNPCYVSPFKDAGYDVADFYNVDPRYGTNQDLKKLVDACHRNGMRLILDLVAGHTSNEHPWFVESRKPAPNRYSNWYIWTDSVWTNAGPEFSQISGAWERDGNYVANYFYFQPALNYGFAQPDPAKPWQLPVDHPDVRAVRAELKSIMRFWLATGVDGFRVDMAESLVKNDPDRREITALWRDVRSMLDREYPEAVLISEWSWPTHAIPAGFHVDFMIHFKGQGFNSLFRKEYFNPLRDLSEKYPSSVFHASGRGDIRTFLREYLFHLTALAGKGYIAVPSGNHDMPRLSVGRTEAEIKVALAFLLTLPGPPFIYYGDEIGMRGFELPSIEGGYSRTGSRTPMQWEPGASAGFSSAAPKRFYLPLDPDPARPNVASQQADPDSILNLVKRILQLRRQHAALGNDGSFSPLLAKPGIWPLVFERRLERHRALVVVNPTNKKVSHPFRIADCAEPALESPLNQGIELIRDRVSWRANAEPFSFAIFDLSESPPPSPPVMES